MNLKRCLKAALFLFCFLSAALPAGADFSMPERPDGYVTDRAGLLKKAEQIELENYLRSFEAQTSNQVAVALFPSLQGGNLEDVSIRLAEKWKLGRKDRDNGVLFIVFRDDRQMRIEVGYGLEGALPDALAAQIIRVEVIPHFKRGDFKAGIFSGINAVCKAIRGEYAPMPQSQDTSSGLESFLLFLVLLGGCLIVDLLRYGVYFSQNWEEEGCYGFWEWFFLFSIVMSVIFSKARGGGRWSSGGGGSSGGFSGGGGSFGGGGASGRW